MAQIQRVPQVTNAPITLEIEGYGAVQVDPTFARLPPDQQEAVVAEITQAMHAEQAQGAGRAEQQPGTPLEAMQQTQMRGAVGAAQGAGHIFDNAAELLQGGYNATLGHAFGASDSATRANLGASGGIEGQVNPDAPIGGFEGAANQLGEGSPVGNMIGQIGASALLTRGAGGPIRQGAAQGLLMSDAQSPWGMAMDTVTGGIGGKIGDVLVRGASRIIAPRIEDAVRYLRGAGVRQTPGQVIPALREFEDRTMNWPLIGPQIQRARREGFEDFARAIPRQAHDVIRTRIPSRNIGAMPANLTGHQAIKHAGDEISAVYNDVIPRLQLHQDPQLIQDIADVGQRVQGEALSPTGRDTFERVLRNGVMGRFNGPTASGEQYQAADTFLERQIARYGRSDDPDHQIIADAFRDVRGTLRNAITRQNGALGQQLEAADEAWSMLVPAETAGAGAVRGFFSPAQYRSALRRGDNRVRARGMARGEVRGQEMAEAGQDVLPPTYPNYSGTSGAEAYNLTDARLPMGAVLRLLYGRGTRDALTGAAFAMDSLPQSLTQPIAQGLDALPASAAGSYGALTAQNALLGR